MTSISSSKDNHEYLNLQKLKLQFSPFYVCNNYKKYPDIRIHFKKIRSLTKAHSVTLAKYKHHEDIVSHLSSLINLDLRSKRRLTCAKAHVDFLKSKLSGIYQSINESYQKKRDSTQQRLNNIVCFV